MRGGVWKTHFFWPRGRSFAFQMFIILHTSWECYPRIKKTTELSAFLLFSLISIIIIIPALDAADKGRGSQKNKVLKFHTRWKGWRLCSAKENNPVVGENIISPIFVPNNLANYHFFPLFNLMICPHCMAEDRSPMNIQSHCNTPSCLFQSRPNNMSLYPAGAFSCCIYELAALYIFILRVLNNCRRAATLSPKLLGSHLQLRLTAAGPSRPTREHSGYFCCFPGISSPSIETSKTWFVHTSTSTEGLNGAPLFRTALQWRGQT